MSHEFGHYIADMGNFLGDAGDDQPLYLNLRTNNQTVPSSVLTTDSMQLAFSEGWADYVAAVVPSLVNTAWLHIPLLNDSKLTLKGAGEYDAAVAGGWGEDNEISVMRILYQLTQRAATLNVSERRPSFISPFPIRKTKPKRSRLFGSTCTRWRCGIRPRWTR